MAMKPEVKAKQKARQEAEWARQRGEAPVMLSTMPVGTPNPIQPPIDNAFVKEGCEQFPSVDKLVWEGPSKADEPPEIPPFPIHATADEVLADPDKFPPVVVEAAKEMNAEAPRRQRAPRAKK